MTPRTVKIDIGGTSIQKDILKRAVDNWSLEQVQRTLRQTAIDITDQQIKLGNKPSSTIVDNSSFKTVEEAAKKIVITYGTELLKAVIVAVERAIIATVEASTDKVTGRLADIGNWEWTLVPGFGKGDKRAGPVNPLSITSLSYSDRLILRPKLAYATAANQNVAGGRKGISLKTAKRAKLSKAKRMTRMGFFGSAAELLRRDPNIRQVFSVYASFTRRFLAEGEVARAGKGGPLQTGQIVLRPKRRGRLS